MKTELITPSPWVIPLNDYVGWERASGKPLTTIKLRSYHLRRFAVESRSEPFSVTLDGMVAHLARHASWSMNYRRSVRTSLRSFYTWAHVTGRTGGNESALLPKVPAKRGRPRPASDYAAEVALSCTDPRTRLMIKLAGKGLRCCEIALVGPRDVLGDRSRYSLLVHGKGGKEREVPIGDDLVHELLERGGRWTFPGAIDGHLSAGYISKLISWACHGLATAHPFRHRYATRALRASGGNIRVVQELLGHSSSATTDIYTEVLAEELRHASLAA